MSCSTRAVRWIAGAVVLALATAARVDAQRVNGQVRAEEGGRPLAGAIVSVIGQSGDTLSKSVTGTNGRFSILLKPGSPATVLVRAIGFRPLREGIPPLPADSSIAAEFAMQTFAITLSTVTVSGMTECGTTGPPSPEVVGLWGEIATALELAQMAPTVLSREYDHFSYVRSLTTDLQKVIREQRDTVLREGFSPFRTISPELIARDGYVRMAQSVTTYLAPNEAVLLDEKFIATHCFFYEAKDPDSRSNVGLGFQTTPGHEAIDIDGVFWIDSNSRELRKIRYNYSKLPIAKSSQHLGGELHFGKHPEGTFYLTKWWVRMPPVSAPNTLALRLVRGQPGSLIEQGGEVFAVREKR